MRQGMVEGEKPLYWIGSAKDDLLELPPPVRREIGFALGAAQMGGRYRSVKPWKGLGSGIYEVISDFDTNTFRGVYTVRFKQAVYALHCFQKKSPRGIQTARGDVELFGQRLKIAKADYETRYGKEKA